MNPIHKIHDRIAKLMLAQEVKLCFNEFNPDRLK